MIGMCTQELMEAEARPSSEGSKRTRRLPAGMSDYQAAWITEEELQDAEDSNSEDEEEMVERQGGDAEPRFGDMGVDGAASMADLDEEDDQTDDMQVQPAAHVTWSAWLWGCACCQHPVTGRCAVCAL